MRKIIPQIALKQKKETDRQKSLGFVFQTDTGTKALEDEIEQINKDFIIDIRKGDLKPGTILKALTTVHLRKLK